MYKKYFKRLFDIIFSLGAIITLSPMILIIALINVIAIRGKPFFVQERVGKGLIIFRIIKFKTMIPTSKKINNEIWSHGDVEFTPIGEILRRWSIDELPTLWNVLLGQMSMIGPRPLLKSHISDYKEKDYARHNIRPGITGLAQVNGRNSLSWEQRYDYDLIYVSRCSFKLDINILIKSIAVVLRQDGHNPYGDPKKVEENAE